MWDVSASTYLTIDLPNKYILSNDGELTAGMSSGDFMYDMDMLIPIWIEAPDGQVTSGSSLTGFQYIYKTDLIESQIVTPEDAMIDFNITPVYIVINS